MFIGRIVIEHIKGAGNSFVVKLPFRYVDKKQMVEQITTIEELESIHLELPRYPL